MKGLRPLHASQELKRDFFDNLTFSRLGEGFYSCAVFMLLGRSIQHSQTDTNDQCTQPRPRGTPILIGAGWRSQTIGEIFKGTDGACADPDTRIFPATGHKTAVLPPILIQLTFTSHTAFFGTFLVRPALLPYGKRGFRAAIYKIARPQPPAAALWLQERIVPPSPSSPSSPRKSAVPISRRRRYI